MYPITTKFRPFPTNRLTNRASENTWFPQTRRARTLAQELRSLTTHTQSWIDWKLKGVVSQIQRNPPGAVEVLTYLFQDVRATVFRQPSDDEPTTEDFANRLLQIFLAKLLSDSPGFTRRTAPIKKTREAFTRAGSLAPWLSDAYRLLARVEREIEHAHAERRDLTKTCTDGLARELHAKVREWYALGLPKTGPNARGTHF